MKRLVPLLLAAAALSGATSAAQETHWAPEPTLEVLLEHYERAEAELRAADVSHLDTEQRARRAQALDWLGEYRRNADFGRNTFTPGARTLAFVDEDGRRCAVAWLLDAAGEEELVLDVARTRNHAYVAELAGNAELLGWLEEYGLSVEDAARIQGPGLGGGAIDQRRDTIPPPAGGTWSGPGDTVPQPAPGSGGPATPGPGRPTGPAPGGGPTTPGPGGPVTRPQNPLGPTTASVGPGGYHVGPEVWMTWWELHKMDYLRPNLLRNWLGSVTQWTDDGIDHLQLVRDGVVPHLRRAMSEDDPVLRASATIALARLEEEAAVEDCIAALEDPSQFVRERALLALGATGSMKAAGVLLDVLEDGAVGQGRRISPDARSLAVIALAIGRRNGMSGYVDMALVAQLPRLEGADRYVVQGCALLYQTLNPNPALSDWCLARATDETTAPGVRCRALETLRTRDDDQALSVLLHALSGRRLDERRSAALALGEFPNPLALQPLLTAAETEAEPLTRSFVLLSIGRRGGPEATAFLREFLEEGPKSLRSWAAIGLGIAARQDPADLDSREALRAGLGREKNREAKGAYLLALGIARDMPSLKTLERALVDGSSYEIRSAAAMGLGMLEDEKATDALRARLEKDHCEYTRAAIAEAIGFVGDHTDNTRLAESYQSMKVFENQRQAALALGLHGQRNSVEELLHVVGDEERPTLERAAAIDALQIVLGKKPSLTLSRLLRQSNFLVYPPPLIAVRSVLL
jgi:HEAT repeat protein